MSQSAAECLRQYESLRRQVLESKTRLASDPAERERIILERQGLLVWMKHAAAGSSAEVTLGDEPPLPRGDSVVPRSDWVRALASLAIGVPPEVPHG